MYKRAEVKNAYSSPSPILSSQIREIGVLTPPLGDLKPGTWRMIRFSDVRAAIRLISDGMRNANLN